MHLHFRRFSTIVITLIIYCYKKYSIKSTHRLSITCSTSSRKRQPSRISTEKSVMLRDFCYKRIQTICLLLLYRSERAQNTKNSAIYEEILFFTFTSKKTSLQSPFRHVQKFKSRMLARRTGERRSNKKDILKILSLLCGLRCQL